MKPVVDLILLGKNNSAVDWPLGQCMTAQPEPVRIFRALNRLTNQEGGGVLIWDNQLGLPEANRITRAFERPGHVWHAGLKLGMSGLPASIDFIEPIWMYNRDPDCSIECTSWRMSLTACLISRDVMWKMGHVNPVFESLEAAGLEMGHRYLKNGVFTRHIPWLVPGNPDISRQKISPRDEAMFLHQRYGKKWLLWAMMRNLFTGRYQRAQFVFTAIRLLRSASSPAGKYKPYSVSTSRRCTKPEIKRVSIIIPTLERYSSLARLLELLDNIEPRPLEILVADQTPSEQRPENFFKKFRNLPLQVLHLSRPGQCISRNAAIAASKGDYFLFLDDDVETTPDIIAKHLENLTQCQAPVSSGVILEDTAGPLPTNFTFKRIGDVFPGGNTCVKKNWLKKSGLFDLAYDSGPRGDHDLGMRLYLSGAILAMNPDIPIVHRHCPRGGLRFHKAREVTYSSSRKRLLHWHLPHATEIYFALRYYKAEQLREMLWLRAAGAFRLRGTATAQILKFMVTLALVPLLFIRLNKALSAGRAKFRKYPRFPGLN